MLQSVQSWLNPETPSIQATYVYGHVGLTIVTYIFGLNAEALRPKKGEYNMQILETF